MVTIKYNIILICFWCDCRVQTSAFPSLYYEIWNVDVWAQHLHQLKIKTISYCTLPVFLQHYWF
jgi:hypothetical protein